MKIVKIGIPLAVLGSVIALGAGDAYAVARAKIFPIAFFGSSGRYLIETDNNAGDTAEGRWDGNAATPFVRAEILAGAVSATMSLLDSAGNVVSGCIATDPAPPNGSSVTVNCPGPYTGAVAIQLRVN